MQRCKNGPYENSNFKPDVYYYNKLRCDEAKNEFLE